MGMKIVENCYIEKYYKGKFAEVSKTDSKDPLMIEEEEDLVRFRFYDIEEVFINGKKISNVEFQKKYSGMYYFGERISSNDLFLTSSDDVIKKMQLDYLNRLGIDEAIFCEKSGEIIPVRNSNDRTIDEVRVEEITKNASVIFVNQKDFLNKITEVLQSHSNDVDVVVSESFYPIANVITGDEVDDEKVIIRTYDLYVNEYKVLSSSAIVSGNKMELENKDTYIRLSDAMDSVISLYQEFPYLEKMMYNFKLGLWKENKGMLIKNSGVKRRIKNTI